MPARVRLRRRVLGHDGATHGAHLLVVRAAALLLSIPLQVLLRGCAEGIRLGNQLLALVHESGLARLFAGAHLGVDPRLPAHLALGDLILDASRVRFELLSRVADAVVASLNEEAQEKEGVPLPPQPVLLRLRQGLVLRFARLVAHHARVPRGIHPHVPRELVQVPDVLLAALEELVRRATHQKVSIDILIVEPASLPGHLFQVDVALGSHHLVQHGGEVGRHGDRRGSALEARALVRALLTTGEGKGSFSAKMT